MKTKINLDFFIKSLLFFTERHNERHLNHYLREALHAQGISYIDGELTTYSQIVSEVATPTEETSDASFYLDAESGAVHINGLDRIQYHIILRLLESWGIIKTKTVYS